VRCYLAFAGAAPELKAGFVHVTETVSAPTGELAAVCVQRQVPIPRDAITALHKTAAFATHKKYRLLTARLNRFSEDRGYAMIDRWEPLDVHQFRSTWLVAP